MTRFFESHLVPEVPGRGHWVFIVRQARHLVVGHDHCVHVASDVPGHVTPMSQHGFSVLSKLFLYIKFLAGVTILGPVVRLWPYLEI